MDGQDRLCSFCNLLLDLPGIDVKSATIHINPDDASTAMRDRHSGRDVRVRYSDHLVPWPNITSQ